MTPQVFDASQWWHREWREMMRHLPPDDPLVVANQAGESLGIDFGFPTGTVWASNLCAGEGHASCALPKCGCYCHSAGRKIVGDLSRIGSEPNIDVSPFGSEFVDGDFKHRMTPRPGDWP